MLYAFDGKVNVIFGTHTHVPTADAKITENGTGYITDLGMCGPVNSILGVDSEAILRNMRHKLPTRFVTAEGPCRAMGAIFETDASTGKCTKVSRVEF
jgi:calcineurin-like phosphoesterase